MGGRPEVAALAVVAVVVAAVFLLVAMVLATLFLLVAMVLATLFDDVLSLLSHAQFSSFAVRPPARGNRRRIGCGRGMHVASLPQPRRPLGVISSDRA